MRVTTRAVGLKNFTAKEMTEDLLWWKITKPRIESFIGGKKLVGPRGDLD